MALQHRQRLAKVKNVVKKLKGDIKTMNTAVKSWETAAKAEIKEVMDIAMGCKVMPEFYDLRIADYEKMVSELTALEQEVDRLKKSKTAAVKKKLKEAEKKLKAKDKEACQLAEVMETQPEIIRGNFELIRSRSAIKGVEK